MKNAEARAWNKDHAEIEVKAVKDLGEVIAHFQELADKLRAYIKREVWDWGEDAECVQKDRAILAHYEAVAVLDAHIKAGYGDWIPDWRY